MVMPIDELFALGMYSLGAREKRIKLDAKADAERAAAEQERRDKFTLKRIEGEESRKTELYKSELEYLTEKRKQNRVQILVDPGNGGPMQPMWWDMEAGLMPPGTIAHMPYGTNTYVYDKEILFNQDQGSGRDTKNIFGVQVGDSTYTGTVGDLTSQLGAGFEFKYPMTSLGLLIPPAKFGEKPTIQMHNDATLKMMNGVTVQQTFKIDGEPTGVGEHESRMMAAEQGGVLTVENRSMSRTGKLLAAPTESVVSGTTNTAIRTMQVVKNVHLPTAEGGSTFIQGPMSEQTFRNLLDDNGITDARKVRYTTQPVDYDTRFGVNDNGYPSVVLKEGGLNTHTPPNVEVKTTMYQGVLPPGLKFPDGDNYYKDLTLEELTAALEPFGLTPSDVDKNKYTAVEVNGKIQDRTNTTFMAASVSEIKRHGVRVKVIGKDGKETFEVMVAASEDDAIAFANKTPGAEYIGEMDLSVTKSQQTSLTDTNNVVPLGGDVKIKTITSPDEEKVDPVDDMLLTGPGIPDEGVLMSEATSEQRNAATSMEPVKVNPGDKTIVGRGEIKNTARTTMLAGRVNPDLILPGTLINMSGRRTDSPDERISHLLTLLTPDALKIMKQDGNSEFAKSYVEGVGFQLYADITELGKSTVLPSGEVKPGRFETKTALGTVKRYFPKFLQVPGMEAYLKSLSIRDVTTLSADVLNNDLSPADVVITTTGSEEADQEGDIASHEGALVTLNFELPAQNKELFTMKPGQEGPIYKAMVQAESGGAAVTFDHRNRAARNLAAMTQFKRNQLGEPMRDPANADKLVVLPSQHQGPLNALAKLHNTSGPIQGVNYLTMFRSHVNGLDSETMADADVKYLANTIVPSVTSLTDGVNMVQAFMFSAPAVGEDGLMQAYFSPAVLDAAKRNGMMGFGNQKTELRKQERIGSLEQSLDLIDTSNVLIGSYIDVTDRTGQRLLPSSAFVQVDLGLQGLAYVVGEVAERVGGGVSNLVTNAMNSRNGDALIAAYNDSIESLKDKLTVVTDGDGNTIRVKRIAYNADGREEINQILGEINADIKAAKNDNERAMAIRQLNIVTMAYQLSSILQGGTGGRTISDQDVALILRALRQGFLSTPQAQVNVIKEVRRMAREAVTRNEFMLSDDPRKVASYMYFRGLSAVSDVGVYHREFTPEYVAQRITNASTVNIETAIDQADLIKAMNRDIRSHNRSNKGKAGFTPVQEVTADTYLESEFYQSTLQKLAGS
jgi:hypothetical protein|tara:strand:- start:858 stop:4565 length:3708 start_codon:yes stop_codon:yes gene_type:complete